MGRKGGDDGTECDTLSRVLSETTKRFRRTFLAWLSMEQDAATTQAAEGVYSPAYMLEVTQALRDAESALRDFIAATLERTQGRDWIDKCGVTADREGPEPAFSMSPPRDDQPTLPFALP